MKYIVNVADRTSGYMRQIVAGFTLLRAAKKLEIEFSEKTQLAQEFYHSAIVEAITDKKRIIFDLSDGYNNYPSFDLMNKTLQNVDVFYKANINKAYHKESDIKCKIKPIPPRYNVTCRNSWADQIDFSLIAKTRDKRELRRLYDRLPLSKSWIRYYDMHSYEMDPKPRESRKVFFYTRLWDPSIASTRSSQNQDLDGIDVKQRIEQKREEYAHITELRTGLVRTLKKEFGRSFIGGIAPDSFSLRYCPDILGEDISSRRKYTKNLHDADICVNTQGTHKCWNFSFGEEIAASKAIVTEKPFYELPAHMKTGEHFFTYSTIDECISIVQKLYDDSTVLSKMMNDNHEYYLSYLRPDKYVETSLMAALGDSYVSC